MNSLVAELYPLCRRITAGASDRPISLYPLAGLDSESGLRRRRELWAVSCSPTTAHADWQTHRAVHFVNLESGIGNYLIHLERATASVSLLGKPSIECSDCSRRVRRVRASHTRSTSGRILSLGGDNEATRFYRNCLCRDSAMASSCASAASNENPSDRSSMACR